MKSRAFPGGFASRCSESERRRCPARFVFFMRLRLNCPSRCLSRPGVAVCRKRGRRLPRVFTGKVAMLYRKHFITVEW